MYVKATPNKFLDSHPNFVKNGGGWEIFIFYFYIFLTALKNRSMLEDTLNTLKLSCQKYPNENQVVLGKNVGIKKFTITFYSFSTIFFFFCLSK